MLRMFNNSARAVATTNASSAMRCMTAAGVINGVQQILTTGAKAGLFDHAAVRTSTTEFINMGFDGSYTKNFSHAEVADHVHGFMCAKAARKSEDELAYGVERADSAFYLANNAGPSHIATMGAIEKFIKRNESKLKTHAVSLRSYSGSDAKGNNIVLYDVKFSAFKSADGKGKTLEEVSSVDFAKTRSDGAVQRYDQLLKRLSDSIVPVYNISTLSNGNTVINIGFNADRDTYLTSISTLIQNIPGTTIVKKFLETFANGSQVYSFYVKGASESALVEAVTMIGMLPNRPNHPYTNLYNNKQISAREVVYAYSISQFAYYFAKPNEEGNYSALHKGLETQPQLLKRLKNLRNSMFQELMDESTIAQVVEQNVALFREMYADFEKGTTEESAAKLTAKVDEAFPLTIDPQNNALFKAFITFNKAVRATNFFKTNRAAVAYRLDPSFIGHLDFPRVPYGIYLVVGSHFRGFHVRFHDIARGGVRMMFSKNTAEYKSKRKTLFQENYGLAYTQMLKNKDIPESGSKGTLLVSPRFNRGSGKEEMLFLQYVDALLDIMIPGVAGVRNTLPKRELLFLGPDENTAGSYPSDAAHYAKKRGFPEWKSLTTGKYSTDGGIPHDVFGMTTNSVREYLLATYEKLGWKQENLVKFQTGGPDGDLGSNEIVLGHEKQKAIVDASGCLYDPNGLDHGELMRLAKARVKVENFDKKKLSGKGFFLSADAPKTTLPDGSSYTGKELLDTFHLTDYATADVFVPCGGRPNAINIDNVHRLFVNLPGVTGEKLMETKGLAKPENFRYRLISEGANLFITPDARIALENQGIILFKDSSANKGGVTSSSFEVYTGLAMADADHAKLMCCDARQPTEMYRDLAKEIVAKIRQNARNEFDAIERDIANGSLKGHRAAIADAYSNKMVDIFEFVSKSQLNKNEALFRYVLSQYTPKALLQQVPLDIILQRVPRAYLEAIFHKQVAINYVYAAGALSNEFSFYEYMRDLQAKADAMFGRK